MTEQVAKKKRVRKAPSNAMLTIRIERSFPAVDRLTDFQTTGTGDLETKYISIDSPQRYVVLEQCLPEAKFDLAKVIKAINGL